MILFKLEVIFYLERSTKQGHKHILGFRRGGDAELSHLVSCVSDEK